MENENQPELNENVDIEKQENSTITNVVIPTLPIFGKATSSSSSSTFSSEVSELLKRRRESDYYYSCTDETEAHQMPPPVNDQLTPPRVKKMRQLLYDTSPLQRYLSRVDANTEALEQMNLDQHFVFSSPEQTLPSPSTRSIILDHVYDNIPLSETKSTTFKYENEKDNTNNNNNNDSNNHIEASTSGQSGNSSWLSSTTVNENTLQQQQFESTTTSHSQTWTAFTSDLMDKIFNSERVTPTSTTSSNFPELLKELKMIRQKQESDLKRHRENQILAAARQRRELLEHEARSLIRKKAKSSLMECFGLSVVMWMTFLSLNIFLNMGYPKVTMDNNMVEFIYFIVITVMIALESCIWAIISYWVFSSRIVPLRSSLIIPLTSQIIITFTLFLAFTHSCVHGEQIQQSIFSPILRFGICAFLETVIFYFTCYNFVWTPKLVSIPNSPETPPVTEL